MKKANQPKKSQAIQPFPILYHPLPSPYTYNQNIQQHPPLLKPQAPLGNQLLEARTLQSEQLHHATDRLKSLQWKQKYNLLTPQEQNELHTIEANKEAYLPHPRLSNDPSDQNRPNGKEDKESRELETIFKFDPQESFYKRRQSLLLKRESWLSRNIVNSILIVLLIAYLIPSFPYKTIILFASLIAYLHIQYKRFQRILKAWTPEPRINQIRHQLTQALSILDASQHLTAKQRKIFFSSSIEKSKAKIAALWEDPSTPIDDLRFIQEAERIVACRLQQELAFAERLLRKKEKAKRKHLRWEAMQTALLYETAEAKEERLRHEHHEAQRRLKNKREQEEEAKIQRVQKLNQTISQALSIAEGQAREAEAALTSIPVHQQAPFAEANAKLQAAKKAINEATRLLVHKLVEQESKVRATRASQSIERIEVRLLELQHHYKTYMEEFERLETQTEDIQNLPAWLGSTLIAHLGCTPQELRSLAFHPYIEAQALSQPNVRRPGPQDSSPDL